MNGWIVAIAILGPMVSCLILTGWVRGVAGRRGFVDVPGGHKSHATPIALGGGIAISASLLIPLIVAALVGRYLAGAGGADWLPAAIRIHLPGIASKAPEALAIATGGMILHVLGLVDDRYRLGVGCKLFVQTAVAAALVVGSGIRVLDLLGPVPSSVITVLWIVGITNAFNFLDNMDGLSAGVGVIAASIFAVSAMQAGQVFVPTVAWMFVGALLGFLWYNFSPASIFMGDAGSMVVGYFLAVLTILTTFYNPEQRTTPFGVLVPLVVLAVPLYDVASVFVQRVGAGQSPFAGDQRHFSHRLVSRGMSPRSAVLTIYLATAATGLPAILLPRATWGEAAVVLAQCLCVVVIIAILEQTGVSRKPR